MQARCLVVLLLLAAAGCNKGVSDKSLEFVNPPEARGLLHEKGGILGLGGEKTGMFVDPRGEKPWKEGHIGGAIHLPFQFVSSHNDRLEGYDTLIVYGDSYNDPLAEGMSKRLIELGFKNVRTLHGGLRAWQADGFELETGTEGVFVNNTVQVQ